MGYQSIFAPSAPAQPTTMPGARGYTSIFTPQPQITAAHNSINTSLANEQQQLKQQPKPTQQYLDSIGSVKEAQSALKSRFITQPQFLAKFAQLSPVPGGTNKYSAGNIAGAFGGAVKTVARQTAQAPARAVGELEASALNKTLTPNKVGKVLMGNTPVKPLQQQGEETAASHPGGFHIKGTPITLTPAETGVALTAGKGALDIAQTIGLAKAPVSAVSKFNATTNAAKTTAKNVAVQNLLKGSAETPKETPLPSSAKVKSSATPVETQVKPGQGSAPVTQPISKPKLGEEGSVDPGQAIKDIQDTLQKHQASTKFSGDLEKNATQVEGAKKVIQEDAAKLINNRQTLSNSDKQTLQDFRDAKAAGLTPKPLPEHLVAEDQATTALNKATQAHDAELARLNGQEAKAQAIEARNPETYTHREAMGKGTALDYVSQGSRKNPLSVSGLSKSTPSSKARVFHAITDEQGNRRVVAIKNSVLKDEQGRKLAQGKLVQAIDNGNRENLGKLKLNTNQDFLDKELKPYQSKIKSLQKEGDALSKVKTKGGVSEARVTSLAQKVSLLEDPGNMTTLTKSEARSLRTAKLKLQELVRVKESSTNAPNRLKTINQHLINMNNDISKIHDKYDPDTLDKKVFVGKDGKKYTVGQATTSEITKATGQKYYTDPKLMAIKNYSESRTALENARFIQSFKDHPDFEKFASEPGHTAPKGWSVVKGLDQFKGYKFEPKTAEVLRDIVKNSGGDEKKLLDQAGKVLRQTIVYFPLKHTLNEGVTYAVDRGLSALANPMAYKRGAQSLVKAFHDVTNMSDDFQAAQKAGLHTVTGGDKALQSAFSKELKNLAGNERTIEDVAKEWGSTPKRIYSAVQEVTVWQLQDILNMARINERMAPKLFGKGSSLEDAVSKTQRYNLQYSVPSRVGPKVLPGVARRGLANTLSSPKVFFGRYRYDLYRIMSNTIKDSVNLKSLVKGGKENAQALDKLAAMALGTAIVWPLVDKGIQKVSGNKNAYMKAPGTLELPSAVKDVAQGKKAPLTEASNQVYLSSLITQGIDLKSNRDSFTGKQVYDPNSSIKQQFADISKWLASQQAPSQQFKQGTSDKSKIGVDILLSLASARLPKNSPEVNKLNSFKFDSLPTLQGNAKSLAAKGDVNGAISDIKSYDRQVLVSAKKAFKSAGWPIPDDKTLVAKLKQQGYYYNPTRATVESWATPTAKKGTLDSILSANPAPKKGQPGYFQYQAQQKQKSFMSKFNKKDTTPVVTVP